MFKFPLLLLFLFTALSAQAAPPESPVQLNYAVYGSGLHAVNAQLSLAEDKNGYTARLNTATTGFLAKVAPWSSRVVSRGTLVSNGRFMPVHYENTTTWRDDAKTTFLTYDKTGRITDRVVKEQGRPDDTKAADPKLTKDAVDLASGIIRFFREHKAKDGCTGQFTVYDGKRRFKVVLANQKDITVPASRYTIYKGPAVSCTVEIIPDGGKWSKNNRGWFKIQEDSRAQGGGLPRIAVASLPNVASWLVPVRLDVASPYGNFVMHLTGATKTVK